MKEKWKGNKSGSRDQDTVDEKKNDRRENRTQYGKREIKTWKKE